MVLAPGYRFGPYEIVSAIGAGGMGEVFRAHDSRLSRDVAIKVLPPAFAQDPGRVARFRREAQVVASLSHPNIAAIYGLEESDGSVGLALELVDGEDLAQRLERGAIPVEDAIHFARQIAEGLEAAHDKGIVHRDLKPANIKITPDGTIKILDFGLAKAYEDDPKASNSLTNSPTMARPMTEAGMILGTAAYMSPEQAKGMAVDKRADIWSFGVVLYEMLTGTRLFHAGSVAETLSQVLTHSPDLNALPGSTPAAVRRLLRRCLERNLKNRLHDIADARLELMSAIDGSPEVAVSSAPAPRRGGFWLGWGLAGVALLVAGVLGVFLSRQRQREVAETQQIFRFHFVPPKAERLAVSDEANMRAFAVSPDGSQLGRWNPVAGQEALHVGGRRVARRAGVDDRDSAAGSSEDERSRQAGGSTTDDHDVIGLCIHVGHLDEQSAPACPP